MQFKAFYHLNNDFSVILFLKTTASNI